MLIDINQDLLNSICYEARKSDRKRKNYNFHPKPDDPIQRMLNAMNPGTYVQPHKHENPDKREIFILLSGKVAVLEFNDEGNVLSYTILDRASGIYGVEVPSKVWHTLIALQNNSVVYEIKDGPYNPKDDKNFASWAPKESDDNGIKDSYVQKLEKMLEI